MDHKQFPDIGVVAIGRNEGERLHRCLASISSASTRVYVDSGSTDGSIEWARANGVDVVELAMPPKFTAARARNAGLKQLEQQNPGLAFVQMIDGDCEMQPGWLEAARAAMIAEPGLGVTFGRLRERFPTRSIYNAMCDEEWDGPIGEATDFGGIILLRIAALHSIGGYNSALIAGEDTDLARRLRDAGWKVARIDQEMALHDAAILHFRQWWARARRSGHAFAELARLHPGSNDPNWVRGCRSIAFWGAAVPVGAVLGLVAGVLPGWRPALVLTAILGALWAAKLLQIAGRKRAKGRSGSYAYVASFYLLLGKIAEMFGMLAYHRNRLVRRESRLIEYKGPRKP